MTVTDLSGMGTFAHTSLNIDPSTLVEATSQAIRPNMVHHPVQATNPITVAENTICSDNVPISQSQVREQPEEQGQADLQLRIKTSQARIAQLEAASNSHPLDREPSSNLSVSPVLQALFSDEATIDKARASAAALNAVTREERKQPLQDIIPGFKASALDIRKSTHFRSSPIPVSLRA